MEEEEIERVVIKAMDDTAEKESEDAHEEAESNGNKPGDGEKGGTEKKEVKKGEWFKRVVSALIAIVTIMGAVVAWRANVAGSDSGNNDSRGLLALQNAEETKAVTDIQANGDEMGYVNYLRNRTIGQDMLNDNTVSNAPPDMQDYIARQITETLDLGNTSKFYFFPDNYLNQNNDYDYQRQVNEAYAQAQETKDLNYQAHFDISDALSNKSMFLLAMLIVLAIALWLLALSEVISSSVKYVTAVGGVLYMILGGLGAYLVDTGQASQGDVGAITWPTVWVLGGLTLLALLAVWALPSLRVRQPKSAPANPQQTVSATPVPPQVVPPQQPYQPYAPTGYVQPPAPGVQGYGPPPPGYGPPPPAYGPPPPAYPQPQVPHPQAPQPPQPPQPVKHAASSTVSVGIGHGRAIVRPATAAAAKKTEGKEGADKEEEEEPFNRIVTMMIATVALIAALLAYLQADASNQSSSANRNSQQYATQALGEQTYGAAEMTYQNQAILQTWKQLEVLVSSATNHGDQAAAKRYQDAADQIKSLSGIFDPKYFDPNTQDLPNTDAFAADLYSAQSIGLSERSIIQLGVHDAWDAKASAYIAHLTLLAVALALFGLGLATSGFIRYVFATAGVLIVGAAIAWATVTYTQPVNSISDQAVDDYAKGVGLAQGGNYDDAIKAYNDALTIEPTYANALYERGEANFNQGTSAYTNGYYQDEAGKSSDAQTSYQESTSKLEAAAKDYEAARAAGRDDSFVGWELGWTYYLLGRFDDAVNIDRHVLDNNPYVIGVHLNLGLALVAQGNDNAAELEYNTAIARTSDVINSARDKGQTVSSDFWLYLDEGASDLYNLLLRSKSINFAFMQAPPVAKIANPDDAAQEAFNMMTKLRNKIAVFEYLAQNGQMPPDSQVSAKVETLVFGAVEEGQPDQVDGLLFPSSTKSVTMYYTYTNILKGQTVSFKIYNNYNHVPEYDFTINNWQNDESGNRFFVVTDPYEAISEYYDLGPGLWTVEMYVDRQMVQIGAFYIENPTETAQNQSQPPGSPTATPTP